MVKKRGQAAMEFLMTYGWALLVVLVAIGALAFFGVLNPGQFLPSTCTITPGIACTDFKVTATDVTVNLQNGMGKNLKDVTLSVAGCETNGTLDPLSDGGSGTITSSGCTLGIAGDRFTSDANAITLSYTTGTGNIELDHSKSVQIVTEIET